MENTKGLGDIVAHAFATVGITKGRSQAVAKAVGLDDCGCEQRQQLLNELGRAIGIGGPPYAEHESPPVVD